MKIEFNASHFLIFIVLCLWSTASFSTESNRAPIVLEKSWGDPFFSEHAYNIKPDITSKQREWRFNREGSTLYFIESECPNCKPYEQADVDEQISLKRGLDLPAGHVMLYNHRAAPAIITWYYYPKKQYIKTFRINSKDFSYTLQFGFSLKSTTQKAFELEQEFFKIVNDFDPSR